MRVPIDPADLPDDVLTDRARDGDTAAFEALLRRYQAPMYALAARITGSPADAEDAVQQAFTTAWRKLRDFRGDAKFSTWLYRVVTNQALTILRRRRASSPLPEDDHSAAPAPSERGPEATVERTALADALAAALAALPDDLRVVWLLREADGCTYEEVASIVGASVSTVRGRLARARTCLAAELAGWR